MRNYGPHFKPNQQLTSSLNFGRSSKITPSTCSSSTTDPSYAPLTPLVVMNNDEMSDITTPTNLNKNHSKHKPNLKITANNNNKSLQSSPMNLNCNETNTTQETVGMKNMQPTTAQLQLEMLQTQGIGNVGSNCNKYNMQPKSAQSNSVYTVDTTIDMSETYQSDNDEITMTSPNNDIIFRSKQLNNINANSVENCQTNTTNTNDYKNTMNSSSIINNNNNNQMQNQTNNISNSNHTSTKRSLDSGKGIILSEIKLLSIKIILVISAIFLTGMVALMMCYWHNISFGMYLNYMYTYVYIIYINLTLFVFVFL